MKTKIYYTLFMIKVMIFASRGVLVTLVFAIPKGMANLPPANAFGVVPAPMEAILLTTDGSTSLA